MSPPASRATTSSRSTGAAAGRGAGIAFGQVVHHVRARQVGHAPQPVVLALEEEVTDQLACGVAAAEHPPDGGQHDRVPKRDTRAVDKRGGGLREVVDRARALGDGAQERGPWDDRRSRRPQDEDGVRHHGVADGRVAGPEPQGCECLDEVVDGVSRLCTHRYLIHPGLIPGTGHQHGLCGPGPRTAPSHRPHRHGSHFPGHPAEELRSPTARQNGPRPASPPAGGRSRWWAILGLNQ